MPDIIDDNNRLLLFLGAGASQFAGNSTFANFSDLLFNSKKRTEEQLPFWDAKAHKFLEEMRDSLLALKKPLSHDNFIWLFNEYKNRCKEMLTDNVLKVRFLNSSTDIYDFLTFKEVMNKSLTIINLVALHQYTKRRITDNDGTKIIDDEPIDKIKCFYKEMAKLSGEPDNRQQLHIFTTNYDSLLEEICQYTSKTSKKIKVVDGMKEVQQDKKGIESKKSGTANYPCSLEVCKGYFSESDKALEPISAWNHTAYEESDDSGGVTIHYYRLHGCFSWFPCPNYYKNPESCNRIKSTENGKVQKPCVFKCKVDGKKLFNSSFVNGANLTDPCTIVHDNDAFGKHSPHEYYFRKYCEKISKTRNIVFIGCAFNDEDIARAILIGRYSTALNKSRDKLRIISVNPTLRKEEIEESFKKFATKLWISSEMVDAMLDIETISLPFDIEHSEEIYKLVRNKLV